ncbi:MAG: polysaccharide biosynthesis/export family protein [Bacteroidales bacterium]|nr:polysaccharide biosynthesis/export family protein [Bacteroidales bacterium]
MKKHFFGFVFAVLVMFVLASCSSKTYRNINYIQDVVADTTWAMKVNSGIVIQPKDQISIIVSSRQPSLAAMYNLPVASYQAGSDATLNAGYQRLIGYVVDNDGTIDFPSIGRIPVAGKTRWELAEYVKNAISSSVKDAIVTVDFMNFKVSVLGEVANPGTFTITGDKLNLLEALSLARDLTIYGRRDNVTVIREQNGQRNIYQIDLRSSDLFSSPAYYLQQNDVVYVYPNSVKAGQSTINENYFKSANFWMSFGSILITVANLIIAIKK